MTKILLHTCCAPCSTAIIEWLLNHDYTPVLFYYNPNVFPLAEYEIRKKECTRYAQQLGIEIIDGDYTHNEWLQTIQGLEQEPERGKRCMECFKVRLLATSKLAEKLGIAYFTTTLASSRWKSLAQIEQAALWAASQSSRVAYYDKNWRKDGLQQRRNELLQIHGFYNQQYCGCEFSMR